MGLGRGVQAGGGRPMSTEAKWLTDLATLEEQATAAPWHSRKRPVSLKDGPGMGATLPGEQVASCAEAEDARLIAAARNALPRLVRLARAVLAVRRIPEDEDAQGAIDEAKAAVA